MIAQGSYAQSRTPPDDGMDDEVVFVVNQEEFEKEYEVK